MIDNIEEIKIKFLNGTSLRQLESEYGINRKKLSKELKNCGLDFSREYSKEIKEKAIELYNSGNSITSIAKQLGIDRHQLSLNLQKWNLRKQTSPKNKIGIFNEENPINQEIIIKYNNGDSIQTIANYYNKSTNFVYRILNKYGISEQHRVFTKYDYNEDIFDIIDTEEKAYWLGFMYADGYISNKDNTIELALKFEDKTHIEKFRNFLFNNLKSIPQIIEKEIKLNNKIYKACRLSFVNEKIKNDLIKNGCGPNKSLTIKFPDNTIVPENLINHFLRGLFDGDGSFSYNFDTDSYKFSCLGTKDICIKYMEVLMNNKLVSRLNKLGRDGQAYNFAYGGRKQCLNILNYLYKDSTIYLDRKHEKYLAVLGRNA